MGDESNQVASIARLNKISRNQLNNNASGLRNCREEIGRILVKGEYINRSEQTANIHTCYTDLESLKELKNIDIGRELINNFCDNVNECLNIRNKGGDYTAYKIKHIDPLISKIDNHLKKNNIEVLSYNKLKAFMDTENRATLIDQNRQQSVSLPLEKKVAPANRISVTKITKKDLSLYALNIVDDIRAIVDLEIKIQKGLETKSSDGTFTGWVKAIFKRIDNRKNSDHPKLDIDSKIYDTTLQRNELLIPTIFDKIATSADKKEYRIVNQQLKLLIEITNEMYHLDRKDILTDKLLDGHEKAQQAIGDNINQLFWLTQKMLEKSGQPLPDATIQLLNQFKNQFSQEQAFKELLKKELLKEEDSFVKKQTEAFSQLSKDINHVIGRHLSDLRIKLTTSTGHFSGVIRDNFLEQKMSILDIRTKINQSLIKLKSLQEKILLGFSNKESDSSILKNDIKQFKENMRSLLTLKVLGHKSQTHLLEQIHLFKPTEFEAIRNIMTQQMLLPFVSQFRQQRGSFSELSELARSASIESRSAITSSINQSNSSLSINQSSLSQSKETLVQAIQQTPHTPSIPTPPLPNYRNSLSN